MTTIGTPLKTGDFEEPFKAVLDDVLTIGSVLYDQLRPHMREPWATRAFRITINDRPEVNAVTWLDADTYCVSIFRGAIEQVFGTMFGLFSCPSFLPGIGNALAETKPSSIPADGFYAHLSRRWHDWHWHLET